MTAFGYWGLELAPARLWAGASPADAFQFDAAWWARQLWPGPDAPRLELRTTPERTLLLGRVTGADPRHARSLAATARERAADLPGHVVARPLDAPDELAAALRPPWRPAAAAAIAKYVIRERAVRTDMAAGYEVAQPFNAGPPPPGAPTPAELVSAAPVPVMLSCLLVPTSLPPAFADRLRGLAADFDELGQPKYVAAGLYSASRTLPPDPFAPAGASLSRDAAGRYRDRAYRFRMTLASARGLDPALLEAVAEGVSPSSRPAPPVRAEYPTRDVLPASPLTVLDELPSPPPTLARQVAELLDAREAAALARLPVPPAGRRRATGPELFVNYRTVNWTSARVLKEVLEAAFGPSTVFLDTDSIPGGTRIDEQVDAALASCRLMLVVIDEDWLTTTDERGRRLDQPEDWVRREVEYGLGHPVLVLPVIWGETEIPHPLELPETMRGLLEWKALKVRHDSARRDLDQLVADVRGALKTSAAP